MKTSSYRWWVRHAPASWGSTPEELAEPYPGDGLIPFGRRSPTMAVTIDATPEQVWPWLVQMGWDRGGWYSWDTLDNGGRPSATAVHPEWQDIAIGDRLQFRILGRVADAYRVMVIEPNAFLGLHGYSTLFGRWLDPDAPRPSSYMEAIWGFRLAELAGGRTRLVISGYQTFRPRWVEGVARVVLVAMTWPMQARMLAVLKRSIERALGPAPVTPLRTRHGSWPRTKKTAA